MKLLITGGAGFIGSHFVRLVLRERPNWAVVNLDLLTYAGNLGNLSDLIGEKRHQFMKGDIRDKALVEKLASECDGIINFAAESHVDRSILGPEVFLQTNVMGTLNLLEAAKKTSAKRKFRYLQISTDEVYGTLGATGRFTEETPLAPNSPYSASKAASDLLVRSYHHTFHLDTVTTRCSNNYGPYQFPEKLIPLMIHNATHEKKLPVYGDGMNIRDWIYVVDHCEGVLAAFEEGQAGEVYNFGADNEWPNIKIVRKLLELLGKSESLIEFVKDRPGHDRRYAIDSTKARRELGWAPRTSFDKGLAETIRFYQENQEWLKNVTSGEYQKFYQKLYGER